MNTNDLLQCALGVHRFDEKMTENRFRCSICKRVSHFKYPSSGFESWVEQDEKGNLIHYKNNYGYDRRYE